MKRLFALALSIAPVGAMAATPLLVHRDPGCGCCETWSRRVGSALKREVRTIDDPRRDGLKARHGVPASLSSCHSAIIDGLIFEGHVPLAAVKRLLAERPAGVRGLAVAAMPIGSLGMEVPGVKAQPYDVIAFGPAGARVYARY